MDYVPKTNTKRDMRCCDLQYVTAEGGSRLRSRSASLAFRNVTKFFFAENLIYIDDSAG